MDIDEEPIPPQMDEEYPLAERAEKWILLGLIVLSAGIAVLAVIGFCTVIEWIVR
jgi:hypothetical protein